MTYFRFNAEPVRAEYQFFSLDTLVDTHLLYVGQATNLVRRLGCYLTPLLHKSRKTGTCLDLVSRRGKTIIIQPLFFGIEPELLNRTERALIQMWNPALNLIRYTSGEQVYSIPAEFSPSPYSYAGCYALHIAPTSKVSPELTMEVDDCYNGLNEVVSQGRLFSVRKLPKRFADV